MHLLGFLVHWVLRALAGVVIVTSVALLAFFALRPDVAEEFTVGRRPVQFVGEIDPDLLGEEYSGVFGIAHNSGDSVRSAVEALAYGADAIEIDVVSLDGRLYASHAVPRPWIGTRAFRGPPLELVWAAATATDVVKLDLKDSTRPRLSWSWSWRSSPTVGVSTR